MYLNNTYEVDEVFDNLGETSRKSLDLLGYAALGPFRPPPKKKLKLRYFSQPAGFEPALPLGI